MREIIIENAYENNLKNISLRIPHYQLIVVTGVSGSGKTSLVYDVLCAEGQRLFTENFSGGRNAGTKLTRPKASRIEGLFPVIAIGQNNVVRSPRSTVGTLTGIYDFLRLLFARLGTSQDPELHPNRSLFSFNLPDGYCPLCKGLGIQDHIDPAMLIADAAKTIREGAFALTTPNNYIVYSQVTMAVLDQVCRAEGFSVDIPWKELTEEQKNVVLYGSTKIKVLFGKHPLESRLKWTGIVAKPREEDYYKGIVPVMEDILRRDRNANILRFARSHSCELCKGKRLNDKALSVMFQNRNIADFAKMSLRQIHTFFLELQVDVREADVVEPVRETILKRTGLLMKLGAGHLSLDRESMTLSTGEAQRIRLANQVTGEMRNILYILDEPSIGLHPSEQRDLLDVLHALVDAGNTVMVVDHDEQSMRSADRIIDIGPGAGEAGGNVLYNGPAADFFNQPQNQSITHKYLLEKRKFQVKPTSSETRQIFRITGADKNNLRNISPEFWVHAFNVITGVSGSGKTSLINYLLENTLKSKSGGTDVFRKVIHLDSSPIGRTPNSNPATYTGISDHIRDLMASLPESRQRGYKKGQFSFVVKGGRCESCGGAGVQQIGMHFLGNVEVVCEVCNGKRFTDETLEIRHNGLNISEILELTVDQAHTFFTGQAKITAITGVLSELGLGYLRLGQPSTTLSGGEAQRVKLASELSRPSGGQTLYILDEPTTGLHMADVEILLKALNKLIDKGNTLLCIEHDPAFILQADQVIDLGPGSADEGGTLVAEGSVKSLLEHPDSLTALELQRYLSCQEKDTGRNYLRNAVQKTASPLLLTGVETNNLKEIDVQFPVDKITAVTGVSGSGKSSLVYGTLYAESQRRFFEGMSSWQRQFAVKAGAPVFRDCQGLIPAISLQKKNAVKNPRSLIATYTGLYDLYRLLFSRLGASENSDIPLLSTAFSFNSEEGACPVCKGLGSRMVCDAGRLITSPEKPLTAGALDGSKTGRFYGDPYGQYVAALLTVGKIYDIDYTIPYNELNSKAIDLALNGCGEELFEVDWEYKRGAHAGVHRLKTTWPGFLYLVEDEYIRKHHDARGEALLDLMKNAPCTYCAGYRLKPELLHYSIKGLHIGQLTALSADEAMDWFAGDFAGSFSRSIEKQAAASLQERIMERLGAMQKAGLGYISTDRIVGTLSGGEFQRLQLAGLVRAPLTGVAYILDEPSFGLHPKDILRISDLIRTLNERGNTIIMVDHSPLLTGQSDYTLELGPGAGSKGGNIVFAGNTRDYPTPEQQTPVAVHAGSISREGMSIHKAYANNLQDIDVEIRAGVMTTITGVSGSGKTSLLDKVIYESFRAQKPVLCADFQGFANFSGLIYIEQTAAVSGSDASVGNMLGISTVLAGIFAATAGSKQRGFKSTHFVKGAREGRCILCEGSGIQSVSMDFFTDIVTPCERCGGSAFRDEVLEVRVDGKTISDILHVPFDELAGFLEGKMPAKSEKTVKSTLELIQKTGLGHLSCGRSLKTVSGGEWQRLKLVNGLASKTEPNTLILLDEPTAGLHPRDIQRLLILFEELIESGNTLVCVTHEPLLMAAAAHTLELGPGGGIKGGRIGQWND